MTNAPFISVLIPCLNEAPSLARCLSSVLASTYPPDRMEILVIDGGSTDTTREIIAFFGRRDPRLRLLENPEGITPCALNHGIRAARGEIIARVDAHCMIAPDYLELCVNHLASDARWGRADNVGGSMRTLPRNSGYFADAIVAALSHPFGVGNSRFRTGCKEPRWVDTVFGGCWRREVFDRIGLFNPQLRRSQDMEFSLRLKATGGRTLLVPQIRCDYYARTRLWEFCLHNFLNGEWAILPFVYSSIIPVSSRHLVPLLFVCALFVGMVILPWTPWALAAIGIPYTALNLLASIEAAIRKRQPSLLLSSPAVFFALHFAYGAGSISGAIQAARIICHNFVRPEKSSCLPQY